MTRRRLRLPDRTAIGLADSAPVNAAMFGGIQLTHQQALAITALPEQFARERGALLPGIDPRAPWDASTRTRMMPFLERQRAAYRSVLSPRQRSQFDKNAQRIFDGWLARGPRATP